MTYLSQWQMAYYDILYLKKCRSPFCNAKDAC